MSRFNGVTVHESCHASAVMAQNISDLFERYSGG
jgi:hypothetical protein